MIRRFVFVLAAAIAVAALSSPALAGGSTVTPVAAVKWAPAVPGVSIGAVEGDMAKGSSHFYLKYDAGFVTPVHHHSPDHYVTVVSGSIVLTVDGKEHTLAPGSYFALVGKAKHSARVVGDQACVMFIDARGPWDVVLDQGAGTK